MELLITSRSNRIFLIFFVSIILLSFSSDLRLGLDLTLNARPDFQFFEIVFFLSVIFLLIFSPWFFKGLADRWDGNDLLMVAFVVNAVFLSFLATDVLHNISRAKDFGLALLLYMILYYGDFKPRAIGFLVKASVLIAVFWSIVGLIQWAGLDEGLGGDLYRLFISENALRKQGLEFFEREIPRAPFAHGLYLYPNNFIYYLVIPFFFSLGLGRLRRWWLLASGIILLAMIATLSKTFMVLMVFFSGIWLLGQLLRNYSLATVIIAAGVLLLVLLILHFGDLSFWRKLGGNLIWRFEIWADTLKMLIRKPSVLLSGDGTYYLGTNFSRAQYPNPHNALLYLLIEYGLLGASLMIGFLAARLRTIALSLNERGPLLSGGFYGICFFLAMGIVDDIFVQTQLTAIIFFYLGMLSQLARPVKDEQKFV